MSAGEVLSNDQVAALVAAAKDGSLPDAPAKETPASRRRRVRKIDFTRPSKFTTDQQRRLERAHETFCRTVSARLSAELRTPVSFEVIDTAQLTWTNAMEEVPETAISAHVEVGPHGGRMLLCCELTLVLGLIERLLGGGVDGEWPATRSLSDVDRALARRIVQMLLDELSLSFGELSEGTHFDLGDLEDERAPSGVAPLSEPTLAMTLEGKLGRMSATVVILMPHRAVEPVLIASDPAVNDPAVDAAGAVGEALGQVEVQLRAEIGSVDLALDEVLALKPGDVVTLAGAAGEDGVTIFADNVALHRARLGRNGRRRAVQVVERVEDET